MKRLTNDCDGSRSRAALALKGRGLTWGQVARRLGVSYSTAAHMATTYAKRLANGVTYAQRNGEIA